MARASLILVNYNTSTHTLQAVAALQGQGLSLELIVVDNASRPEERRRLDALPGDVQLVWSDANLGYGGAINRALPLATAPVVGFLNPDTFPLPGSLKALLGILEDPRVGVVGPRTWWDETRTFLLPPIRLPTLADFTRRWVANLFPSYGLAYSRRIARWVVRVCYGDRVSFLPTLAGAFLLTRREVVTQVGGFDPGFPLYFEDVDWCRRVRRSGYRIAYVPAAEIVHYFDQSARQISAQVEAWRAQSLAHYLRKYYGRFGERFYRRLGALGSRLNGRRRATSGFSARDLGRLDAPPALSLPKPGAFVQVAYHWLFFEAALGIPPGVTFQLSQATWERLRPARYFARALDPRTLRPLSVWTWEKA